MAEIRPGCKKVGQVFSYEELLSISNALIAATANLRIMTKDIQQYGVSDESIRNKIHELLAINDKVCKYAQELE